MKRGAVSKKTSVIVAVWVPELLLRALDKAVVLQDSDRSKLIRRALRKEVQLEPAGAAK
jgi:metal-responsive CopG/Arc/MetJ family transcriptional regulator